MNHSRYNLPSRIGRRFVIVLVALFCRADDAAGQGIAIEATPAGIAAPSSLPPTFGNSFNNSLPPAGSISAPPTGPALRPAAAPAPAPTPPSVAPVARAALPDPQQLLAGSIRMIGRQKSIVAKVRNRALIYDRELIGSGEYAQGPELARLLRYELNIQVDKRVVNLLQVADGRHLWISSLLKDEPEIQRIDIDRVLAATDADAAAAPLADPNRQLGLGGIAQLLAAIQKDFEFHRVYKAALGPLPVFEIEGRWKKEAMDVFDPKAKVGGKPAKTETLRAHVPDRVVLFLGVDDLFPYRLEFRRSVSNPAAGAGAASDSKPLLVLEFFEVQFDVPIEERLFQYSPGSWSFADITDKFLAARKAVP